MNKCDKIINVRMDVLDPQGYVYVFKMNFLSKKGANLTEDCCKIWLWLSLDEFEEMEISFEVEDFDNRSYYTDDLSRAFDNSHSFGEGGLIGFTEWLPIRLDLKTVDSIILSI